MRLNRRGLGTGLLRSRIVPAGLLVVAAGAALLSLDPHPQKTSEASPFPLQIHTVRLFRIGDYMVSNKDLIVLGSALVMMVLLDQFVKRSRLGRGCCCRTINSSCSLPPWRVVP